MNLRCERIVNADTQSIRIANADGQHARGSVGMGKANPYAAAGILAQNKKEELSQVNLDFSSLLFCAERVGFKPTVR